MNIKIGDKVLLKGAIYPGLLGKIAEIKEILPETISFYVKDFPNVAHTEGYWSFWIETASTYMELISDGDYTCLD